MPPLQWNLAQRGKPKRSHLLGSGDLLKGVDSKINLPDLAGDLQSGSYKARLRTKRPCDAA